MKNQECKKIIAKLPDTPGVYIFKHGKKILYIGKATSLRDRVQSYMSSRVLDTRSPLVEKMLEQFDSIEHIKTDSVLEALVLEANLIKKYQPEANVKEKDGRSFNFVVITDDDFPQIRIIRGRELLQHHTYKNKSNTIYRNRYKIKKTKSNGANKNNNMFEVTTANVTDRDGALLMTRRHKKDLSDVETFLVDDGYAGENFAQNIKKILKKVKVEVVKRSELHTFKVLPKRWVVERSFAWLEKCRRLWKNCEKKLTTSRQMIILAFISLLARRN